MCVLDFFYFFFFVLSPKLSHFLCVFFCVLFFFWHNKIVVCKLNSLRGSHSCRPFFGLRLLFGPFFAKRFCVRFICVHKTTKRRPFPIQNSPSREESVVHHHHHHHLVDALPFETPTKFSPKERRGGACGVCRTTTPPKKSDESREKASRDRHLNLTTNSSDAFFFCCPVGLKKSAADDAAKIDRQREEERLA